MNTSKVDKAETEKQSGFGYLWIIFVFRFTVIYAQFSEFLEVQMPLPWEEDSAEAETRYFCISGPVFSPNACVTSDV